MVSRGTLLTLTICFVLYCTFTSLYAQQEYSNREEFKTRVAVVSMINVSEDDKYDAIIETVTDTAELTLKLTGKYRIIRVDNLNPYASPEIIKEYAKNFRIDNVLFGRALKDPNGNIILEMSVYDRLKDQITITKSEKSMSILDIFNTAEALIKGVIEVFSGIHVGFGSIEIINKGEKGNYEVLLNGQIVGCNLKTIEKVLNGEYLLEIKQNRMLGEKIIYSDRIKVYEDKKSEVVFKIPYLTREEEEKLNELFSEIEKNIWNPEKINATKKSFGHLTRLFSDLSFCPSLEDKKKEIYLLEKRYDLILNRWAIENYFLDQESNKDKKRKITNEILNIYKDIKSNPEYNGLLNECLYNAEYFSTILKIQALNSFSKKKWDDFIKNYEIIKTISEKTGQSFYNLLEEAEYVKNCKELYFSENRKIFVKKLKEYFEDDINRAKKFYNSIDNLDKGKIILLSNPQFLSVNVGKDSFTTPRIIDHRNIEPLNISINDLWFDNRVISTKLYENQRIVFLKPEFKGYLLKEKEISYRGKELRSFPGKEVSKNSVMLKWAEVPNASYYRLQIYKIKDNKVDVILQENKIKNNSYIIKLKLPDLETNYFYKVCAVTENGLNSKWSNYTPVIPKSLHDEEYVFRRRKKIPDQKNWLLDFGAGLFTGVFYGYHKIIIQNNGEAPWSYDDRLGTVVDFMLGIHRRIAGNYYLGININYQLNFSDISITYFDGYNKLMHELHILPDITNDFLTFGYSIGIKHFILHIKFQYYYRSAHDYLPERKGIDTYGIYLNYLL